MTAFSIEFTIDAASTEAAMGLLQEKISIGAIGEWLGSDVNNFLQQRAKARFSSEGDDAAGRWTSLADTTVAIREALGYGGPSPINIRTGDLFQYVTGSAGQVTESSEGVALDFPNLNNNTVQAQLSNAQSGNKRTGAPARPVIALGEQDLLGIMVSLTGHMAGFEGGEIL